MRILPFNDWIRAECALPSAFTDFASSCPLCDYTSKNGYGMYIHLLKHNLFCDTGCRCGDESPLFVHLASIDDPAFHLIELATVLALRGYA